MAKINRIKVRATQKGEYLGLRQPGDEFYLIDRPDEVPVLDEEGNETGEWEEGILAAEDQFSDRWMQKCDGSQPEPEAEETDPADLTVVSEDDFEDDELVDEEEDQ